MKKTLFLLCMLLSIFLCADNHALLKFGIISDNHLDRTRPATAERTKLAFELFRNQKVDFFVDCGDVADTYQPDMFRLWRKIYLEVFADEKSRPDFLMIPAGHDRIGTTWEKGYSDFVKFTGSGSVNPVKQIKGYHFVSIAQKENPDILKKNLAAAVAASGKNPVFVITHYPPMNTTPGSYSFSGGDSNYRKILDSYPQAIVISGHTHTRLMDERAIWQGTFTAVNAGTLAYNDFMGIANPAVRSYSYDAAICEVFKDRVIIRRYNVKTGNEIYPGSQWEFPLPFDAEAAPYKLENRQKNFPIPNFRTTDKAVFYAKKTKWDRWGILQFPLPENYAAVNYYRLSLEKKSENNSYTHYGIVDLVNNGNYSSPMADLEFSAGYLEPGSYRFILTPVNYFHCSGTPLKGNFSVKKVPWQEVKNDHSPSVYTRKKGGIEIKPDRDGYYQMNGNCRLILPGNVIKEAVDSKKKLIISLRMSSDGPGKSASMRIINGTGAIISLSTGCYREGTKDQEYSLVFRPKNVQEYSLLFRNNGSVKYHFKKIRYYLY